VIHEVDETLRRLLVGGEPSLAGELARVNPRWQQTPVRVTFEAPAQAESPSDSSSARVNLFLHDVRENRALRSDEAPLRSRPTPSAGANTGDNTLSLAETLGGDSVGLRRPPVRLNLSYIVTVYGAKPDDTREEHQLLTDVLGVFLRHPTVPLAYLTPALADDAETRKHGLPLSIVQPEHAAHAEPSALWQALGGRLRPALGLVALATYNPFETRWTRRVREIVLGMGEGTPATHAGNPAGVPRRPLEESRVAVSAAGVVTTEDGQSPLVRARVYVLDEHRQNVPGATVHSDERGFWALLNLAPGTYTLCVEATARTPSEQTVQVPPAGRPDQIPLLAVALSPAPAKERQAEITRALAEIPGLQGHLHEERQTEVRVSGTLRYENGSPAAFVPVRLGKRQTQTDRDGFYWFADSPQGWAQSENTALVAHIPGVGEVTLPRPEAGNAPKAKPNVEQKAKSEQEGEAEAFVVPKFRPQEFPSALARAEPPGSLIGNGAAQNEAK
jgi:hypothetical protein